MFVYMCIKPFWLQFFKAVRFNPGDASEVLTASTDKRVTYWNARSGEALLRIEDTQVRRVGWGSVQGGTLHPAGTAGLASPSCRPAHELKRVGGCHMRTAWHAMLVPHARQQAGPCTCTHCVQGDSINCLALDSEDKLMVSGGSDKLVKVWGVEDGRCGRVATRVGGSMADGMGCGRE